MGSIRRVIVCAALCALCGCSGRSEGRGVTGKRIAARAVASREKSAQVAVQTPYDAAGNLKPSELKVGWLEIPMGFRERVSSQGTHHAYVGAMPAAAVIRFFDQRVFTSKVELVGNGVRYGAALPKSQDPNALRLEIAVYPNRRGDQVQIFVDERTANSAPLSLEDARALLSEKQARAE